MKSNLELPEFFGENEDDQLDELLNWLRSKCASNDVYAAICTSLVAGLDELPDDSRLGLRVTTGFIDAEVLDIPGATSPLRSDVYLLRIFDMATDTNVLMWSFFVAQDGLIVGFGRHHDPDGVNIQPMQSH